jgi:hypothetical protein
MRRRYELIGVTDGGLSLTNTPDDRCTRLESGCAAAPLLAVIHPIRQNRARHAGGDGWHTF